MSLTVENFVQKIKEMRPAQRKNLDVNVLIDLIIQLPEVTQNANNIDIMKNVNEMMASMNNVQQTMNNLQQTVIDNSQEIQKLKAENVQMNKLNTELSTECTRLSNENNDLKVQVDGIEVYLRVNNLEIAGLDDPQIDPHTHQPVETVEEMVIRCLNGLDNRDTLIEPDDIDICHELPSRQGGKTHVIRFVRRNTKHLVLEKKKTNCQQRL